MIDEEKAEFEKEDIITRKASKCGQGKKQKCQASKRLAAFEPKMRIDSSAEA